MMKKDFLSFIQDKRSYLQNLIKIENWTSFNNQHFQYKNEKILKIMKKMFEI